MARPLELFLDIETDWHRNLTVVGFTSSATGLVQLVGKDITRSRLKRELPESARLYTFNGHSFDLPSIKAALGLDLLEFLDSHDLRWLCHEHGLTGGQKAIEARLGFPRRLEGLDGRDAIDLWHRHRAGDAEALETLLAYNAEDLRGMQHIKRRLTAA